MLPTQEQQKYIVASLWDKGSWGQSAPKNACTGQDYKTNTTWYKEVTAILSAKRDIIPTREVLIPS